MSRRVLLMDNGSLEPASTLQLRRIAAALEDRVGTRVQAVSLAHSAKIPSSALGGTPAELFEAALDRGLAEGDAEIIVLPLFVGPSHAIVRHLPAVVAERQRRYPDVRFKLASPLFVPGERRLGRILADHVRAEAAALPATERPRVAIVDHGSPSRAVTDVRNAIAAQVGELLGATVVDVAACSMERRAGPEFDFNEPLLETLLARPEWRREPVVVGMLFIGPGRHAGTDGDVAAICRAACGDDGGALRMTALLGQHPLLLDILVDRVLAQRAPA